MDIRADFGLRVRELRARSGVSQELLAYRSGLDRSYLGGVERGERNVSLHSIERIAAALDITLSYFFSDERFSTNPAYLKKHVEGPLSERFTYQVDYDNKIVAWQINGAISGQDVEQITSTILKESLRFTEGEVNYFIDHRGMQVDDEPIGYSPEVVEKAEEMHRKLNRYGYRFVVLCNSKFMANQFDVVTKRSGIFDKAAHIFDKDKEMVQKAYTLLDIRDHELVKFGR